MRFHLEVLATDVWFDGERTQSFPKEHGSVTELDYTTAPGIFK